MLGVHPDAELAPRDVVARATFAQLMGGRSVGLDARATIGARFPEEFPTVFGFCIAAGIDPRVQNIPVAPAAHYHMGGIAVDARMETGILGLLAAGEAVGGANGANRLSGNAVTEALVFGRRAGRSAAERAAQLTAQPFRQEAARDAVALATAGRDAAHPPNAAEMILSLQDTMADGVGPFRTGPKLERAIARLDGLGRDLGERPFGDRGPFDMQRIDWLDLRNMVLVARIVARAALQRTESRGAHQREDFPGMLPHWRVNQMVRWRGGALDLASAPPAGSAPDLPAEPGPHLAAAQ